MPVMVGRGDLRQNLNNKRKDRSSAPELESESLKRSGFSLGSPSGVERAAKRTRQGDRQMDRPDRPVRHARRALQEKSADTERSQQSTKQFSWNLRSQDSFHNLSNEEYPQLSRESVKQKENQLPETSKRPRNDSNTSDWGSMVEEYEESYERVEDELKRYKTKREKKRNSVDKDGFVKPLDLEDNLDVLRRRQKDVSYGKNTEGYQRYCLAVPKHLRKKTEPQTPEKFQKCSRRSWDGQIRKWRRNLHDFDNESGRLRPLRSSECSSTADTFSDLSDVVSENSLEVSRDTAIDMESSLESTPRLRNSTPQSSINDLSLDDPNLDLAANLRSFDLSSSNARATRRSAASTRAAHQLDSDGHMVDFLEV